MKKVPFSINTRPGVYPALSLWRTNEFALRCMPCPPGDVMLKLRKDELMFLRWLRTNGGTASLPKSAIIDDLAQRILTSGYITREPSTAHSAKIIFTLTAQGYEALSVHGHG